MFLESHAVELTTDGSGVATGYTPSVTGRVLGVQYVADGSTPFDSTVDATITGETSTRAVVTLTNLSAAGMYYPKAQGHDAAGAAIAGNHDYVPIAGERVKIVLAQGGATKKGTFRILIG